MSETTSVHFINRLREGNETHSWNRFCEIYDPFILGWLLRQGVRDCDAADIRQEVMCTVLCELPKFRHNGSVGAFRCWLRLVTVNELRRFRRRHRRELEIDLDWLATSLASMDHEINRQFDAEHDQHLLSKLLDSVQTDFQDSTIRAFRMTAFESLQPAEAAERLGMTKAAVIAGKSRVLCRLREAATQLFTEDD